MTKSNIYIHKKRVEYSQFLQRKLLSYLILCSVFLGSSCCHTDDIIDDVEVATIDLQIYNLYPSGSMTVSDIAVVNGVDSTAPSSYPFVIDANGGSFITTLQSNSNAFVLCDVILVIQNVGDFRIEIKNSTEEKMLTLGKNRIVAEGSLSFNFKGVQWYIKTTIVDNKYSVLMILNSPKFFIETILIQI